MADHKVAKLSNPKGDLAMIILIVESTMLIWELTLTWKRGHQSAPGGKPLEIYIGRNTNTQMKKYKYTNAEKQI